MTRKPHTKFAPKGQYGAEVDDELIDVEICWAQLLSLEDVQKLEDVREALRRGDLK